MVSKVSAIKERQNTIHTQISNLLRRSTSAVEVTLAKEKNIKVHDPTHCADRESADFHWIDSSLNCNELPETMAPPTVYAKRSLRVVDAESEVSPCR